MAKPILVLAGLIRKEHQLLIAQRKKDSKVGPSQWEFPGGKLEDGEGLKECLAREIEEELGLMIQVNELFDVSDHTYHFTDKEIRIVLIAYMADWKAGEVQLKDCQDAKWVTVNQLQEYDFAAADIPIVKRIQHSWPSN
jgi:8-oxo-dGTP diphosphatase